MTKENTSKNEEETTKRIKKQNKSKSFKKDIINGKCIVDYSLTTTYSTHAHITTHPPFFLSSFRPSLLPRTTTHIDHIDTRHNTHTTRPARVPRPHHTLSLLPSLPPSLPPRKRKKKRRKRGRTEKCGRLFESHHESRGGGFGGRAFSYT